VRGGGGGHKQTNAPKRIKKSTKKKKNKPPKNNKKNHKKKKKAKTSNMDYPQTKIEIAVSDFIILLNKDSTAKIPFHWQLPYQLSTAVLIFITSTRAWSTWGGVECPSGFEPGASGCR